MARARSTAKGRRESGNFLPVPHAVLDSENFCSLSNKSKALVLDIGARFTGYNNGNLAAPWSWMKARGWKSKDTLQRALEELRRFGMIEVTRQGGLNGPSLYAFTWQAIDDCSVRLDVPTTRTPSGKWKHPPNENARHLKKSPTPSIREHRPDNQGSAAQTSSNSPQCSGP